MHSTMVIVWDERDKLVVLNSFFQQRGYTVRTTHDCHTGFAICHRQPPDIAIIRRFFTSDRNDSGLELCRRLRATPDIPIFPILLGDADISHKDWRVAFHRAYAAGANACFRRVFQIDKVWSNDYCVIPS
jgi:CheY-like chemotaxis protein